MVYFILWIMLSALVGAIGSSRKIGFGGAFLWSLLLSPLLGFVIAIVSPNKEEEERKQAAYDLQKEQYLAVKKLNEDKPQTSIVDDLTKLAELKEKGLITDEEMQKAKDKLLGN
ncbi:SHOCT domain-containing protein [Rufibacter immobilis]|uniref:SHOCT domain-containing protein n=1 Tax=Rufibacter immobilis TaxID=1348778 RepID=A0A3M9MSG6_9BACT|nr:SHOCT domain-containing protein [Rufibacter immobilis]RNI27658.1 SHOCT domain-containing protein [Rufibacter immobilis]